MPYQSTFPPLDIPETDLLTFLFGDESDVSDQPIWHDAANPSHNLSPKQLLHYVKRLALGLDNLGLKKGDVVMIYTPNHIHVPAAYLGITGSHRIFSGANPTYTVQELTHQINNTKASLLLCHPSLINTALAASNTPNSPIKNRIYLFSDTPSAAISGVPDWHTLLASPAAGAAHKWTTLTRAESRHTTATVNFSSGTTGLPKGVRISHANIIANVMQTVSIRYHAAPRHADEKWLAFLPLYHAYGQLYTILMAARLRVPVYVMGAFAYDEFLAAVQRFRISDLQVAPPVLVMLAKRPETARYDLRSVRSLLCGAAPLSAALQEEVCERFGVVVYQGWGMTEVTCGAMVVPGGVVDNSGSVGPLLPNTECKLVDDAGNEVATGQPGELYVRGPQVCLGYWDNEAATRETLSEDGWLRTGDVMTCDERGWFTCVDRKKELIKVNALQVAPAELEAVLLQNDSVSDAACVGVTLHGEEWPRAYVALKDDAAGKVTERDIQAWISSRVAKHKRLVGGVAFVAQVPKLASGKIQRKVMREWAKRDAPALEALGDVRERAKL